jgi:hypothetical protein
MSVASTVTDSNGYLLSGTAVAAQLALELPNSRTAEQLRQRQTVLVLNWLPVQVTTLMQPPLYGQRWLRQGAASRNS